MYSEYGPTGGAIGDGETTSRATPASQSASSERWLNGVRTGWTWLGSGFERRTKLAATLAVAILPLQITVGAITVTLSGLIPGGYTVSTHAAHLSVALIIFTLLGLATIWGGGRGNARLLRAAAGIAVAGIVASAVFSRAVPFLTYAPPAQAAFYITGLAGHLGLVAAVAYATEAVRGGYDELDAGTASTVRALAAGSLAALVGTLLLGRDLVLYTATWQQINLAVLAVAVALAAGAAWTLRGADEMRDGSVPIGGD